MTEEEMEKNFLLKFIFAPEKCWLPNEYKPIMKRLNVWAATSLAKRRKIACWRSPSSAHAVALSTPVTISRN